MKVIFFASLVIVTCIGAMFMHATEPDLTIPSTLGQSGDPIAKQTTITGAPPVFLKPRPETPSESLETKASTTSPGKQRHPRALSQDEILVKYKVRKTNCFEKDVTAGGATRSRTVCDQALRFDHHYDQYSYEQLLQIHATDGLASYILGMKTFHDKQWQAHFDYQKSVAYLHQAAVLTGKAQPYLDMLKARQLSVDSLPRTEFLQREAFLWYRSGVLAGVISDADIPLWMSSPEQYISLDKLSSWNELAVDYSTAIRNQRSYATGLTFE